MNAAILDRRPAAPGKAQSDSVTTDLVRVFGLDRLPAKGRLVCHWHRDAAGHLACRWELELDLGPDSPS
jgi:hypothetical protein